MSYSLQPHGLWSPWISPGQNTAVGSLSLRLGDLPNPGIKFRSPILQSISLPAEPQGKPKNTGVGSLSLLQGIFPTQELNQGLLNWGGFFTIWAIIPRWCSGKESACLCRRHKFDHCVGKIPWRRNWQPTSVFLPGETHGQSCLMGYSPWGHKESGMTKWLSTHIHECAIFFWVP